MSTRDLEQFVENLTDDERCCLFVLLAKRMRDNDETELAKLDRRMADLDAGRKRLNWDEFERRLSC